MRGALAGPLARLTPRQREILVCRFLREESQKTIAARMEISESRVCQIGKNALKTLRAMPEVCEAWQAA